MRMCLRALYPTLLVVAVAAALAETPRDLIRQGNEHYAAGRFAEALQAYEAAAAEQAAPPELLHDRAAAYYQLGDREQARDLWVQVKAAGGAALEARALYNLGNCDYQDALAAAEQNPRAAIAGLDKAIALYRAALALDPQLTDARANLELAAQLKRQIEEQTEEQPQSQPSSQQCPESQPSEDQQQKQEQQQDQQQQQQQDQAQEQKEQEQQDQQQSDQQQSDQPQSQEQEPQDQQQQQGEQQQGEEQPQQEQSASGDQQQSQPESSEEPQAEPRELPPIDMTQQQAERLLQMIRDAEKARREMLARQQRAQQQPVERDW